MFELGDPLPMSARLSAVIGVLVSLLTLFHVVFIYLYPLSKIAWKRVDYVWISFGALGLISAVSQARSLIATNALATFETRAIAMYEAFQIAVEGLAADPGIICMKFANAKGPLPEDKLQGEFNEACEWIKSLKRKVEQTAALPIHERDLSKFMQPPETTVAHLNFNYGTLASQYGYFSKSLEDLRHVREMARRTWTEDQFLSFSPFFLSIALAIRFTKVTGEVQIERTSAAKLKASE